MAWSSAEYCLSIQFALLMSEPDLRSFQKTSETPHEVIVPLVVDTNAVNSIFWAIDSNRGRRDLVGQLAIARNTDGKLSAELLAELQSLLESMRQLATRRNRYAHTAISVGSDGYTYLRDKNLMINLAAVKGSKRDFVITKNRSRLNISDVHGLCDDIADWIAKFRDFTKKFSMAHSLPERGG